MDTETLAAEEISAVQNLNDIHRKMHFTGTVMKTTLAGAVVDIGLDVPGVVHISQLKAEPVNRVEDVVHTGQTVDVWVRRIFPKKNRVELTMIKPLNLDWREIDQDMVIHGKVTRLENFGVFVDIGAERPGLVHISEMTHEYIKSPSDMVKEGDEVDVKVLEVNRRKKQIRLSMKALEEPQVKVTKETPKQREQQPAPPPAEPEETEEPVPTAMAMALREAMERSKDRDGEDTPKNRGKTSDKQIDDILDRTLQNRVRSTK
jgi:small subunit ribosomal protein S1